MFSKLLEKKIKEMLIPDRIPCDLILKERIDAGEKVSFETSDAIILSGSWYQGTNDRTVIFSHSFGANRYGWFEEGNKDFIDMIPSIKVFIEAGYNILLFDHRACGESEGSLTYFGRKEALDIEAAFHWIRKNKRTKTGKLLSNFILLGFSSGANATLFAIEKLEKINTVNIVGLLSNIYWYSQMFPNSVKYFTKIPRWVVPSLNKATKKVMGFDPNTAINPLIEASKVKSPLFFVHSKYDKIANTKDIEKLFNVVNSYKEILLLDGERFDSYHFIEKNKNKVFDFIEKGFNDAIPNFQKTAVLTIEYQKNWTEKGFFCQLIKKEYNNRNVLKNSVYLLDLCRKNAVAVIHAPLIIDKKDAYRYKKAPFPARFFKQLTANSWKSEMTEGIYKREDKVVVGRSSYDACIDSDLNELLKFLKIERVVLCGFTTDHCIKETYESLTKQGIHCIIAEDCTATMSQKKQDLVKSTYPVLTNAEICSILDI